MPVDQQPCTHCGECARACPVQLDPEALFFALTDDAFGQAYRLQLSACTLCAACDAVCPSHIPLSTWLRWGQSEQAAREHAAAARARFEARTGRLAREQAERAARRRERLPATPAALPTQTISHAEVLAAIARGQARKHTRP